MTVAFFAQQFGEDFDQFLFGPVDGHAQHPGGLDKALEMVVGAEDVKLPVFVVPVPSQAAEDRRAVVEGMGHHADGSLLEGDDFAVEISVVRFLVLLSSHGMVSLIYAHADCTEFFVFRRRTNPA